MAGFEVIPEDPDGSGNLGHFAVDRKTGDLWDAVICERITSPSLLKLQQAVRERLHLTEEECSKIRTPGPLCGPHEKARVLKAK